MADYYPLIARAVAGLEKNTGDARRMLYEQARKALVTQLRGSTPPLSESEITKERLALEEAIRKVEADTARRLRMEAQAQSGPPVRVSEPARLAEPPELELESEPPPPPPAPRRDKLPSISGADPEPVPPPPTSPPFRDPAALRASFSARLQSQRKPLSDEGLKGFRDVVAETETLGRATAQASKSARDALASVPDDPFPENPLELPLDSEHLAEPPVRESVPRRADKPSARQPTRPAPLEFDKPSRPSPSDFQKTARPTPLDFDKPSRPTSPPATRIAPEPTQRRTEASRARDEFVAPPRMPPRESNLGRDDDPQARRGLVAAIVAVFFILTLGVGVFWQRDRVALLFNAVKGSPTQTQRDAPPSRPKITDRVGQPGDQDPASSAAGGNAVAPVAQRVVLYEEDPADPSGKRYTGTAVWRMDNVPGAQGQPPELAVRADVEIPERRITMTLTMRRNADQNLPASHTIEIMFNLPADFPFGGISNVPGILMKQAEQTRGTPLAGLAVKVTSGFFLVGLSSVEGEQQRNIQLLKERAWFDIPIVYNNGRRAILAVEKGNPGDRVFETAFAAWNPAR